MKRRDFLRLALGAGACLGTTPVVSTARAGARAYPFPTLREAMDTAGFDARAEGNFTAVWTADLHYGHGDSDRILPPILREINAMRPLPAFFGIAGDLICKASLQFGQVPGSKQKTEAIAEFKLLEKDLQQCDPGIPVKLALGNHDTYPGEDSPDLFHTVFPQHPEYHAFEVNGIPFIFLNGGSCGHIDSEQRAWFCSEVARRHKDGGTLIIVCHQPSLGSVTAERGIPAAIRQALSDCQGDLWMVSGHSHRNADVCYQLSQSVITQATITTANPDGWGSEHPGYWVYGFSQGKLVTRIFRRFGHGFAIASPPPRNSARPILLPFEGQPEILWKVLVGEGDKPFLEEAKAAWCLDYWHYNRHLIYKFPLSLAGGKAKRFAILEKPCGEQPRKYFVSADGEAWQECTAVDRKGSYTSFAIPQGCLDAGTIVVRMERCVVSGFALTR